MGFWSNILTRTNPVTGRVITSDGSIVNRGDLLYNVSDKIDSLADLIFDSQMFVIDAVHRRIHEGNHYFIKKVVTLSNESPSAQFLFATPDNDTRINARVIFDSNVEVTLSLYEGTTTSNNGTPVTAFNNDRNSTNTPELLPYVAPTVTDNGSLIWRSKTGDGKGPSGVSPTMGYEIIAKQNTKYLFNVAKTDSGDYYVNIDFFWYES